MWDIWLHTSRLELLGAVVEELVNLLGLDRLARVRIIPLWLRGQRADQVGARLLLFEPQAVSRLEARKETRHGRQASDARDAPGAGGGEETTVERAQKRRADCAGVVDGNKRRKAKWQSQSLRRAKLHN